jgi:hypothetical protein
MTNELFLFIILVLILLYFLPERKHTVKMRFEKRQDRRQKRQKSSSTNIVDDTNNTADDIDNTADDIDNTADETLNTTDETLNTTDETIESSQEAENIKKKFNKKNLKGKKKLSMEVINDYLSEVKCEEGFNTMGSYMNIGNDMSFQTQQILPKNNLDKVLSKSLVPDFEPSALNINPDLNSFGYATNNPSDNNFYENRGYIDPIDASQYANSVQYNLAYPYQTRYCDK